VRVNVRLVAATHRDLAKMAAEGQYRSDLYYRLHVFPVRLPPLRERQGDIPLLVRHFVRKYAQRLHRPIESVAAATMAVLKRYSWPGNVRELEHLIERAVILAQGTELHLPADQLLPAAPEPAAPVAGPALTPGTLQSAERELILRALEECRWVIGGASGAAARLGLKRTTLLSRMEKLGIRRPQ
jgi:formate hydrogenlyase transcriptional activator